ncbi:MAG: phosphatidate cytidylyltransferase [Actinomycetaceae bacterium]|nr:phosphatidate cytidylyltransferase [Actinomycetaceae bacterium]MDY6082985.1 phosphatidate cytidylyltransferase [Actinomycetaceae bacterium]
MKSEDDSVDLPGQSGALSQHMNDMGALGKIVLALVPHPPRPPHPSRASHSKAGRSLKAAVPTALLLLGIVAAAMVWLPFYGFVVAAFMTLAVWELTGAWMLKGVDIPFVPVVLAVWMMAGFSYVTNVAYALAASLIWVVLIVMWCTIPPRHGRRDIWPSLLIVAWVGIGGSCAVSLVSFAQARWLIACLVLLPVASDTGGWALGVLCGKHKMAPKISPGKTWEGFAGSLLLTVVVASVMSIYVDSLNLPAGVLVGVLATLAAVGGDLLESKVKRYLGVKDLGSVFPGHGGAMDRVDSILLWAPCVMVLGYVLSRVA